MGDLYRLMRDGSFVVTTRVPLGDAPAVTVAATLFCRDGSTIQLLRRPPEGQASSGPFADALEKHRANVASRLGRLSRELFVLRTWLFGLGLLLGAVFAGENVYRQVQETANDPGVRIATFAAPLVRLLAPAAVGAALQWLARAGLRWWLKKNLAGSEAQVE